MNYRRNFVYRFKSSVNASFLTCFFFYSSTIYATSLSELAESSLEDLLNREVTSVSRKQENLYTAPASVYVITAEDIRRRGVTDIPEALAMAPGLLVRAIDGNKWSVATRGHSGVYSNKLLVQIDGRSIYTPVFSGVYWDQHNIPMGDVERIEVIRGSGATLWGANAVNGIVNIITKQASDSQGGYLHASAGSQDNGSASFRYGDQINDSISYRVNAQLSEAGENTLYRGAGTANDGSNNQSINFRVDSEDDRLSSWMLSGGYYDNTHQQTLSVLNVPPPTFSSLTVHDEVDVEAYYLSGNWTHMHENGAESRIQLFWDRYERDEIYLGQNVTTYDFDYQLTLPTAGKHNLILGTGYRSINADFTNTYAVSISPADTDIDLFSLFIQDEYSLIPDTVSLTFGSKFEHHDYTGWEIQPNLRLSYTPSAGHFTWASVSKAVRTPSIAERGSTIQGGITVPTTTWVKGSMDTVSENVISYEIGYRYFASNTYTFDASFFYSDYDDYLSFEQINPITFQMGNKLSGKSYGFELAAVWQPSANWQLAANYSYLDIDMVADADSTDPLSVDVVNSAYAKNMFKLHSAWDITPKWTFDTWVYYIDSIPVSSNFALFNSIHVEDVISTNFRLGWKVEEDIELALTAQNIFDNHHLQSVGESFSTPTEIDRAVTFSVDWTF